MKVSSSLILVGAVMFSSCSSLMMSVKDRDDSNKQIVLMPGQEVAVHMPEVRPEILGRLQGAGWMERVFCQKLQGEVVEELARRGVQAVADSSREAAYLSIYVDDFSPGSGLARALDIGIGGASKLQGVATLRTADGARELELKKRGQKGGLTEGGDQTSDNIHYFAGALASRITIESQSGSQAVQK